MSMNEVLGTAKDTVVDSLKTRFGDPILSTYIFSFLIYNWQIFIVIFSELTAQQKIDKISGLLHPSLQLPEFDFYQILCSFYQFLAHPFVFPLISSVLILFVLPKVLRTQYALILNFKVQKENDRFDAETKLNPIASKIKSLEERIMAAIEKNNSSQQLVNSMQETITLQKKTIQDFEKKMNTNEEDVTINTEDPFIIKLRQMGASNTIIDGAMFLIKKNGGLEGFKKIAKEVMYGSQPHNRYSTDLVTELIALKLVSRTRDYINLTVAGSELYAELLKSQM